MSEKQPDQATSAEQISDNENSENRDNSPPSSEDIARLDYEFRLQQARLEAQERDEQSRIEHYERERQKAIQERRNKIERLILCADFPERHREANKTILPGETEWHKKGKMLVELEPGAIVALVGPRGTGKTQLAVAAGLRYCRREKSVRYIKTLDIFLEIRASYSKPKDSCNGEVSERSVIRSFVQPAVLILDEISVRGETEFEDRLLVHIIDGRYDALKTTIILTNQTAVELCKALGPSITSRIKETGGIVQCDWPSFRDRLPTQVGKRGDEQDKEPE